MPRAPAGDPDPFQIRDTGWGSSPLHRLPEAWTASLRQMSWHPHAAIPESPAVLPEYLSALVPEAAQLSLKILQCGRYVSFCREMRDKLGSSWNIPLR